MYADKKVNTKPSPIQEGDTVLLCQEKKNKLSTPFEGIPYTVFQKNWSNVTAERITDGRMVTRNTKDFKSCLPSTKETTQATLVNKAECAIVAVKPPSTVDVAEQNVRDDINKCCAWNCSLTSSPQCWRTEIPKKGDTILHDLRTMCVDRDTKIDHSGTLHRAELTKY